MSGETKVTGLWPFDPVDDDSGLIPFPPMRRAWLHHSSGEHLREEDIETPAYVYDELVMSEYLEATRRALDPTGARLLLAMKAFSFEPGLRFATRWLHGLHASSPFEARLARRVFESGIVHTTVPGMREADVSDVVEFSDRVSFNSISQWRRFGPRTLGRTSPGIRVNPGLSFVEDERYDPSARHSKLGVPIDDLAVLVLEHPSTLSGIEGLLVHNNCESTDFRQLLKVVERLIERLHPLLQRIGWVNLGGGYLFAEADDLEPLHSAVKLLTDGYGVEVTFEPGTGIMYQAGALLATVVDIFDSGGEEIAVLDTSVSHAPEVLEFQFVPEVVGGSGGCHPYVLAGASCLPSDTFGRHCMTDSLKVGSRVTITEVGAYSLVKASWFNGLALPNVYSRAPDGQITHHKRFSYEDFLAFSGGTDEDHRDFPADTRPSDGAALGRSTPGHS